MRRLRASLLACARRCSPRRAAVAQTIVTSAGAGPGRRHRLSRSRTARPSSRSDLDWLNGFALISETRPISLPAGESRDPLRGRGRRHPAAKRDRHRAFRKASSSATATPICSRRRPCSTARSAGASICAAPRAPPARSASRRRSSAAAPTARSCCRPARGFEALRCTGLPETLVYDGCRRACRPVRPCRCGPAQPRPVTATVTLSYLASGFDWQANYVATLSPDGGAGRPVRLADPGQRRRDQLRRCRHPGGRRPAQPRSSPDAAAARRRPAATCNAGRRATTSDIPLEESAGRRRSTGSTHRQRGYGRRPCTRIRRPNLASASPVAAMQRAQQEDLGDLKLYRIPEPVTVAANSPEAGRPARSGRTCSVGPGLPPAALTRAP